MLLLSSVSKIVGKMANSVDPDQTAPWEQSDQGLLCLYDQFFYRTLGGCGNAIGNQGGFN